MALSANTAYIAFSFFERPDGSNVGRWNPGNQLCFSRKMSCRVNCNAEGETEPTPMGEGPTPQTPPLPLPPPPPPPPRRKVSTKFSDVFAFSGPAPETINGRLAMLGFVSAVGVELVTGDDLLSQVSRGDGVWWFLFMASVFTAASLIPIFKGVSRESRSPAFMSSTAETWNGRVAMLGLAALALTEYLKGGPLVS